MVIKILAISDNHGIDDEMVQLLADYRDSVDYIVHCGDSEFSKQHSVWSFVDASVKGNMDFGENYPIESVFKTSAGKVYVTHGHLLGVNRGRLQLSYEAKEKGAGIAFYGHTHVLGAEVINDVLCINPGSFNHSRGSVPKRTFAIVCIDDTLITVQYFDEKRQHLTSLDDIFER